MRKLVRSRLRLTRNSLLRRFVDPEYGRLNVLRLPWYQCNTGKASEAGVSCYRLSVWEEAERRRSCAENVSRLSSFIISYQVVVLSDAEPYTEPNPLRQTNRDSVSSKHENSTSTPSSMEHENSSFPSLRKREGMSNSSRVLSFRYSPIFPFRTGDKMLIMTV